MLYPFPDEETEVPATQQNSLNCSGRGAPGLDGGVRTIWDRPLDDRDSSETKPHPGPRFAQRKPEAGLCPGAAWWCGEGGRGRCGPTWGNTWDPEPGWVGSPGPYSSTGWAPSHVQGRELPRAPGRATWPHGGSAQIGPADVSSEVQNWPVGLSQVGEACCIKTV